MGLVRDETRACVSDPVLNIVLVEPEIPQNTGNIARTCACIGAPAAATACAPAPATCTGAMAPVREARGISASGAALPVSLRCRSMRMDAYSLTSSTSRMHITIRYPITAPGSPVKFTSSTGTNRLNPNVIRYSFVTAR